MELYERVNNTYRLADKIVCWVRRKKPVFEAEGDRISAMGAGYIPWNFGELAEPLAEELNAVWEKYHVRRVDQLKRKFMDEFLQDTKAEIDEDEIPDF